MNSPRTSPLKQVSTGRSMTARAAVPAPTQYVTLGIDQEIFAVEVSGVREILDFMPISRVPYAPAYMLGIIDVRGAAVAVIDLRSKLGLTPITPTPHTRILVLDTVIDGRALVVGLVADRVFEVTDLGGDKEGPAPDIGTRWRSDYIKGVARRGDAFVIIFDLPRLFTAEEAVLLKAGDS